MAATEIQFVFLPSESKSGFQNLIPSAHQCPCVDAQCTHTSAYAQMHTHMTTIKGRGHFRKVTAGLRGLGMGDSLAGVRGEDSRGCGPLVSHLSNPRLSKALEED